MDSTNSFESIGPSDVFKLIKSNSWEKVIELLENCEDTAQLWNVDIESTEQESLNWKKLPIHEACIENAPVEVIHELIGSYVDGAKTLDSFGRLPLHHACFHNAPKETLQLLLDVYPEAVNVEDSWGFIPCIPLSRDLNIAVDGVIIPVEDISYFLEAVEAEQKALQQMQPTKFEHSMLYSQCLNSNDTNEIECTLSASTVDREKTDEEQEEPLDYKELFENHNVPKEHVEKDSERAESESDSSNQSGEDFNDELEVVLTKHALEIAAFEKLIDRAKEKSTSYGSDRSDNRDDYVENYSEHMESNFDDLEDQLLKVVDSYEELMELLQSHKVRISSIYSQEMEMNKKISELEVRAENDSKTISRLNEVIDSQNIEYEQKMDEVDMIVKKFEEQKEKYIKLYEQYKLTANKLAEAEMVIRENYKDHAQKQESSAAQLEDELKQLREHYVELEREYNAVSIRAKSLEETVRKNKLSSKDDIKSPFKQKYEEEKVKCQDLTVKLRFATSQITLLENEVHEYSKRNINVEKMRTSSMKELDDAVKENYRLQQDISLNASIISLFKVKAKEDNNRIATLEESIVILKDALVAQKIKYKNMYYEQVSKQIEVLEKELGIEKRKNDELHRQNAYTTARLKDIEHMLSTSDEDGSKSALKEMEKSYNHLKEGYEKAVSKASSLEELVNKYRKEISLLKESKTELQGKIDEQHQEINNIYLQQDSRDTSKSFTSESIKRDDSNDVGSINNEMNQLSGRDDSPSDRCTDSVHRSRNSPISSMKRSQSSNAVNVKTSSTNDTQINSELRDVSSTKKMVDTSDKRASNRTLFGVRLRRTEGGILD